MLCTCNALITTALFPTSTRYFPNQNFQSKVIIMTSTAIIKTTGLIYRFGKGQKTLDNIHCKWRRAAFMGSLVRTAPAKPLLYACF